MRRGSAILLALALLLSLAAPAGAEGAAEFEEPASVEETPVESEPVEEASGEEPPPEEEPEEPVEEPEEAPPIESDEILEEPPAVDAEPPAGEPSGEPEEAPPIESDEILEEPPAEDAEPPAGEPSEEPGEAPPIESGEEPEAPGDTGKPTEGPGTGETPPTEGEEPPAVTPEDPDASPETPGDPADAPVVTPGEPAAGGEVDGAMPSPAPESAPLPEEDLVILSQAGLAMAAASAAPAVADIALDTDAVVNVTLDAEAYPILINPYTIAVTDYGEADRSSIVSIPNLIRNDGDKPIRFSALVTAYPGADLVLAETSTRVSPPADDTQSAFLYLELANLDDPDNIGNLIWTEPEDFTAEYDRSHVNAVLIQDSSTVDTTVAPGVDIYSVPEDGAAPVPNTAALTGIPANGYAAYRIGGDSSHPRYYGEWMSGDYDIALSIFFDFSIPQEDMRYKVSFTVKDFLYGDQPPGYASIAGQSIIIAGDYYKSGEYYLCPVTDTISFKLNMTPFEVYYVQYEAYQLGSDGVTKEQLLGKENLYTPNEGKPLTPERELMIPEYDFNEHTLVEITVLIMDPEGRPDLIPDEE